MLYYFQFSESCVCDILLNVNHTAASEIPPTSVKGLEMLIKVVCLLTAVTGSSGTSPLQNEHIIVL